MSTSSNPGAELRNPTVYHVTLKGHLGCHWAGWFEGLTITCKDDGNTLLSGPVIDQAALHGLLRKIRDLGMPLISVMCVELSQLDDQSPEC